ncbi:hypothetical protein GF382_00950 [Candidatus Falkowbacteria bacterium]|nr:hypothetical protein [Candidatus Falkowbacteria bacterium]
MGKRPWFKFLRIFFISLIASIFVILMFSEVIQEEEIDHSGIEEAKVKGY